MGSLPAGCILWEKIQRSIFELYGTDQNSRGSTLFIMSFIWRIDNTDGKDKDSHSSLKHYYGPQIAATFMFVLGVIYLRLMIHDAVRTGSDSGKMRRMERYSCSPTTACHRAP
jgi:hypothetical protein